MGCRICGIVGTPSLTRTLDSPACKTGRIKPSEIGRSMTRTFSDTSVAPGTVAGLQSKDEVMKDVFLDVRSNRFPLFLPKAACRRIRLRTLSSRRLSLLMNSSGIMNRTTNEDTAVGWTVLVSHWIDLLRSRKRHFIAARECPAEFSRFYVADCPTS